MNNKIYDKPKNIKLNLNLNNMLYNYDTDYILNYLNT
jgi:hypothetical protein